MARVIVVGSINQDITVTVDRFPSPGETLSGSSLTYGLGGKGANQAAAAAHSGAETLFVGAVGTDLSGQRLRADLAAHGVDVTHVRDVDGPTGTALITVAASGENTIILDAGANRAVTIEPAKASLFPAPSDIVVLQAEVPSHTNTEVLAWAHSFGARVLLNLAPARDTDPAAMSHIDILVVNETEAGLTLGLPAPATPTEAIGVARALRGMGPRHVVVTLGAQGGGVGVGCRGGSLSRCQPRRGRGHHGRGRRVRGCAGGSPGARQALRRGRGGRHAGGSRGDPVAGSCVLLRCAADGHARLSGDGLPRE